jgi:DNA-binding transcriptional ArsR family regulator
LRTTQYLCHHESIGHGPVVHAAMLLRLSRDDLLLDKLVLFNFNLPNGKLTMRADPLSVTFAALADPTRRAILARLARGEATVKELAEPFDITPPAVTKHLKVLQRAGLIAQGRAKQWRPCRLQPQPLKDAADWVETYRQLWEQRLDRLEDYLRELRNKEK